MTSHSPFPLNALDAQIPQEQMAPCTTQQVFVLSVKATGSTTHRMKGGHPAVKTRIEHAPQKSATSNRMWINGRGSLSFPGLYLVQYCIIRWPNICSDSCNRLFTVSLTH